MGRERFRQLQGDDMDGGVKSQDETDEDILTFDIPDDALERADFQPRLAKMQTGTR
jgi:hypothetical protein